jgi:hypothetical protein
VTCATAVGWAGAVAEELPLRTVLVRETLRFEVHGEGRRTHVVTDVDGPCFSEYWLAAVEQTQK